MWSSQVEYIAVSDLDRLGSKAAEIIIEVGREAITQRGRYILALPGGRALRPILQRLALPRFHRSLNWSQVHVFWADEQCVPSRYQGSNYRAAEEEWLRYTDSPVKNIYGMLDGTKEPAEAVEAYEQRILETFGLLPGEIPTFDLVFLDLDKDQREGSFFSGSFVLTGQQRLVVTTCLPELDIHQLKLASPVLNNARCCVFIATGLAKYLLPELTESGVYPKGKVVWLVNEEAATTRTPGAWRAVGLFRCVKTWAKEQVFRLPRVRNWLFNARVEGEERGRIKGRQEGWLALERQVVRAVDAKFGLSANQVLESLPISENTKQLALLRNKHRGRRCFVIGNGPSLQVGDLDKLGQNKDITVASNKIYLAFDQTDWRPSYFTVADMLVAEQNTERINQLELVKLFPESFREIFENPSFTRHRGVHLYYRSLMAERDADGNYLSYFSPDALTGFHVGQTITNLNIQLAYYLGCNPIYVIGIDGTYTASKATDEHHAYGEVYVSGGERNHFLKGYRQPGERWSIPNPEYHEIAYRRCREFLEAHNVKIFNASRRSVVKAFERIELDKIL